MNALVRRREAASPYVLICDHASNHVPAELDNLGLPPEELSRHIAWDIGAAGVTEVLSEILDAPAVLCQTSRLVIDCNRQLDAPDLIPAMSDGTVLPANADLTTSARQERIERWFWPYHEMVEAVLAEREARGLPNVLVSIHSMTDCLAGVQRPWQIALSSYLDRSLTDPLLAALREPGDIVVGDNEPYDLDPAIDFSTPYHAIRRGLPHLQVEFRQDEVADASGEQRWAVRFATALTKIGPSSKSATGTPSVC